MNCIVEDLFVLRTDLVVKAGACRSVLCRPAMSGYLSAGIRRKRQETERSGHADRAYDDECPAEIEKRGAGAGANEARKVDDRSGDRDAEQQRDLLEHARKRRGRAALRRSDVESADSGCHP